MAGSERGGVGVVGTGAGAGGVAVAVEIGWPLLRITSRTKGAGVRITEGIARSAPAAARTSTNEVPKPPVLPLVT